MKKDLEDQKQKTEGVAEWIKNTFRPGMEKMKEMIDQEVKQLKDKLAFPSQSLLRFFITTDFSQYGTSACILRRYDWWATCRSHRLRALQ